MHEHLNFSLQEYQQRLDKVRTRMVERDLDTLIIHDPSNMAWLTGYDGWSFYTPQAVVIGSTGEPIWFGRHMDASGALRTVYMHAHNVIGYPDHFVMNPPLHAMQYLATDVLPERAMNTGRIGVEMDNYYFSHTAYKALEDNLPQAQLCDATAVVNFCRAHKSEREMDYMRIAAQICDRAHAAALEMIEPGLPKNRLAAHIYQVAIQGIEGHGGDYPAIVPIISAGADASAPHLTWDDSPFREGEGCFLELAGCYKRYHSTLSRTIFLGKPSPDFMRAEQALNAGLEAGLAAAKPGNTCADIAHALNSTLAGFGFDRAGARCGYPIGLSYPPDWGERSMSLRESDNTVLEPGMTFHFMPGLWMDNWGMETTESIHIIEGGVETLCNTARKLFVKP
ncbi:MAG: M24 family metallopeptidase [Pseudomonadales bacterium]